MFISSPRTPVSLIARTDKGALAIICRSDDSKTIEMLKKNNSRCYSEQNRTMNSTNDLKNIETEFMQFDEEIKLPFEDNS